MNNPGIIAVTLLLLAVVLIAGAINIERNCGVCDMPAGKRTCKQQAESKSRGWVVLVHGLLSGPRAMSKIGGALHEQGFQVLNFTYDSRKETVASASMRMGMMIQGSVPKGGEVHFVTHSMGSLIVRRYMADGKKVAPGRVVMIAPPNKGSAWARLLLEHIPFINHIIGVAGREVAEGGFPEIPHNSSREFGIIAGGTGNRMGLNPFIPGDNDGTVSVEETRLRGMKAHIIICGQHTLLLYKKRVICNVISFLEYGTFEY